MTKFTFATSEEGFDNHISNSIRGYDVLNENIVSISKYFVEPQTNVFDLGCSTGNLINKIQEENPEAEYYGIELCEDFAKIPNDNIAYLEEDIRDTWIDNASFVTSVFTLQFVNPEDRLEILSNIYHGLNVGGGFVVAENVGTSDSPEPAQVTSTTCGQSCGNSCTAGDNCGKASCGAVSGSGGCGCR